MGACASSKLRYHYRFERLPASYMSEKSVRKIEISLRDPVLFASGADSTFLLVKLFDEDGNPVTKILPHELMVAASEDIEVKPFSLKQGVYKAQIRPRVKSPRIQLQVDWLSRVTSPLVTLETTMSPLQDKLKPNTNQYVESNYVGELNYSRGDVVGEGLFEGFDFQNVGDNPIVNAKANPHSQRTFHFDYLEQARQNIQMTIDDAPNSTISHTMHSIFMFFPRQNLPYAIFEDEGLVVNLPNTEKMIFNPDSKEIIGGVFEEGPVDISNDRTKRRYADLKYKGKGVVLRVNARGQSPELGQFETLKIDMNDGIVGSADVLIMNGSTGQKCRRPKKDFWEPIDVNPIQFKFPTDAEFEQYLLKNCGFGIPKL